MRRAELVGEAGDFRQARTLPNWAWVFSCVLVHQDVNGRALLPGGHRHVVRHAATARPIVFPVVAGEFEVVLCAVVEIGLAPAFDEQVEQGLIVIVPDALPVADFGGSGWPGFDQIVTPALLKLRRQILRPGQTAGGDQLRLIGERTGNALAELLAECLRYGSSVTSRNFSVTPGYSKST